MADTNTKTEIQSVKLGSETFEFEVKLDNRSKEDKGAFLALPAKKADIALVNRFAVAAGQGPLVAAFVRAINKIVGPASKEAFNEVNTPDGKTVWQFDASKASNVILGAIADSVSAAKDELEAKIAEARGAYEAFFDASVVPLMASGRVVPAEIVNKMATLRTAVAVLEKKLAGKTRPKKAAAAPAPAK